MTNIDEDLEARENADVPRRVVLRGVTVGGVALPLLAACGGGSNAGGSSSSGGSSASGGSSGSAGATVAASAVPVGGGKILKSAQVVVTQPKKGEFKAFTAICTHQGCVVSEVKGGQIHCPCHGSIYSIKDGSPISGPAPSALAAKKVSVKGGGSRSAEPAGRPGLAGGTGMRH